MNKQTDVNELQRQLSEISERLATMEVAYLGLTKVAEKTVSMLEQLIAERRDGKRVQALQ
jgi:choline kinase